MLRSRCKPIALIAMMTLVFLFGGGTVKALSEEELLEYSLNDIMFYQQCETTSGDALGGEITISGSTAEEKIWSGLRSFLSDVQAAGVMGNIGQEDGNYNPLRREVGQSGSLYNRNAQMGLGFVQWSFGRRVNLLNYVKERDESLLKYFEDDSLAQISGDAFIKKAGDSDANKVFQVEIEFLKSEIDKSYKKYYDQTDVDTATVWFREHFERAGVYSDKFRKEKANAAYNKYAGKDIVATSTTSSEGSVSSCNSNEEGSLNINGAGVALAWPLGTPKAKYSKKQGGEATPALEAFIGKKWPNYMRHPYCSGFPAAAVRYSGYDKKFTPNFSPGDYTQAHYANRNKDLWEVKEWNGEKSELQGGDILNSANHSWMIVEDESGELYIAEGSVTLWTYGHIIEYRKNTNTKTYIIRAKKAKNSKVGVNVKDGVKTSSTTGVITNSGERSHNIGASAVELAWPYSDFKGDQKYRKKPTDKFKKFYDTLSGRDGDKNGKDGKSCDYFVHTVLVYAGLENNDTLPWGNVPNLVNYMEKSADWQEVQMADNRKLDEYKDGDIVFYFCNDSQANSKCNFKDGQSPGANHVAILVEADGKKYTAQASYGEYYGVIKGTGNITGKLGSNDANFDYIRVFRNNNNKNGVEECNICDGEGSEAGQLKAGGFTTVEEATAFMQSYIDAVSPGGKYYNKTGDITFGVKNGKIHDAGCPYGVLHNCVAFSQWFVNNYTTVGPNWNNTTNGVSLVGALEKKGLKRGTEPRPYAIFSKKGPSYAGHTGVILGVDEDKQKVIVGDAACNETSKEFYKPRAYELSFSDIKDWWYAYTDDVLSIGGPLKNV